MKRHLLLFLGLFSSLVQAELLTVEYSVFYGHLRKIDAEETNMLQFAFGFKHVGRDSLCNIEQVTVETQKKDIPIPVSPENRFTLPTEKALKLAKAEVQVVLTEPANMCDMSVQLETRPEWLKSSYQSAEIQAVFSQYRSFFDDMGGFLSFLMPDVTGLRLVFPESVTLSGIEKGKVENNTLYLNEDALKGLTTLILPAAPSRITAVTAD